MAENGPTEQDLIDYPDCLPGCWTGQGDICSECLEAGSDEIDKE